MIILEVVTTILCLVAVVCFVGAFLATMARSPSDKDTKDLERRLMEKYVDKVNK